MTEENKNVMRRIVEEGFNQRKLDVFDELVSPDFVNHNPMPGLPADGEGWKLASGGFLSAFPDLHLSIDDQIAEGDRVTTRFTGRGTHQGDLMGIPPTGRSISVGGINVVRVVNGKVVERWEQFDMMGMMTQLGVIPAPAG